MSDIAGKRPLPDYVRPLFEEGSAIPNGVRFLLDRDTFAAVIEWIVVPFGVLAMLVTIGAVVGGAVVNAVRFGFVPLRFLGFLAIATPFALLLRGLIRVLISRTHTGRAVGRGVRRRGLFLFPDALVLRGEDDCIFVPRADITGVRLERIRSGNSSFEHVMVDLRPDGVEPASVLRIDGCYRKTPRELMTFVKRWLEESRIEGYRDDPHGR